MPEHNLSAVWRGAPSEAAIPPLGTDAMAPSDGPFVPDSIYPFLLDS